MCFVIGLVLIFMSVLAIFLPPRPRVWIYNIVVIALGFASCCCMPATIPLLIFWLRDDTKHYFGRS